MKILVDWSRWSQVGPMHDEVKIVVRGINPIPWGSNEWAWRKALADGAREVRAEGLGSSRWAPAAAFLR